METSKPASVREEVERTRAAMMQDRREFDDTLMSIRDVLLPEHGEFSGEKARNIKEIRHNILNNTGEMAVDTFAAGMLSGKTSPAREWFDLGVPDPDLSEFEPVKEYFQDVVRLMREVFLRSNVYRSLATLYKEFAVFGTCGAIMMDDRQDIIRIHPMTIGQYYIAQDERNMVTAVLRDMRMSVSQMVGRWGLNRVSNFVRRTYEQGNYNHPVEVSHLVEPELGNTVNPETGMRLRPTAGWRSVYWERQKSQADNGLFDVGAFDMFPFVVPRYNVVANQMWGYGPGHKALGDVRELQQQELLRAQATEMMADPALQVPPNSNIVALPGAQSVVDVLAGERAVSPLFEVRYNTQHALEAIELIVRRINEAFHVDLFKMMTEMDRRDVTAREIVERHEEKLLMLGPTLMRLNDELLSPLIEYTYMLMLRHNMLPPTPPELEGQDFVVRHISIMDQAQKAVAVGGIERFIADLQAITESSQSLRHWHKIDAFNLVDVLADNLAIPQRIIRSDEEAEKIASAQEQQAQAAQNMEMASVGADTAKALSEVDPTGQNALANIVRSYTG